MLISKWWWRSILWKKLYMPPPVVQCQPSEIGVQKPYDQSNPANLGSAFVSGRWLMSALDVVPRDVVLLYFSQSKGLGKEQPGSWINGKSTRLCNVWICLGNFWVMSNPSQCVWLPKKSPWHTIFSIARWFIQLLAKSLSVLGWLHHPTAWWFVSQAYGMGIGQNWQTNSYTTGSQTGRSSWWQKMWHLWSNLYGLLSLSMIRSDLSILIIYDYDICVYILYFLATQIWTCQERCLASHHHLLSMTMLRKIWRLTPLANVSTTSSEAALGAPI